MTANRNELLDELAKLSVLFPSMRFGQLLEMVTTLAGAQTVADMERTNDAQICHEAKELAMRRSQQIDVPPGAEESLNSERRLLITVLRQDSQLNQESLIRALIQIARESNTTAYDIEDEALLQKLCPQNAVA